MRSSGRPRPPRALASAPDARSWGLLSRSISGFFCEPRLAGVRIRRRMRLQSRSTQRTADVNVGRNMTVELSSQDQQLLSGEAGECRSSRCASWCMRRKSQPHRVLIDITSAHVGSNYSSGPVGLDFARRLAATGARVAVPATLNTAAMDLMHCKPLAADHPEFSAIRELVDHYVTMGCEGNAHLRAVPSAQAPRTRRAGRLVGIERGGVRQLGARRAAPTCMPSSSTFAPRLPLACRMPAYTGLRIVEPASRST